MKLYKLTDQQGRTRAGEKNETQWGDGVTNEPIGTGTPELCTDTVIHAYTDPLLALLMNPIHADLRDPLLWECDGDITVDGGDKCGCTRLTTIRQIEQPALSTQARVAFAIFCARQVYSDPAWGIWAENWLSGKDRTAAAAYTATAAAAAYSATSYTYTSNAANAAYYVAANNPNSKAKQVEILKDIINPYLPILNTNILTYNNAIIPKLAKSIYNSQNYQDLPILADILEDANEYNPLILSHLRSEKPHYKGCWVIDLLGELQ